MIIIIIIITAEVTVFRKDEKYAKLDSRYLFRPIAVETLGVFNSSANSLLKEIGLRIPANTGESREASFLYQRISVLVQRFNACHSLARIFADR